MHHRSWDALYYSGTTHCYLPHCHSTYQLFVLYSTYYLCFLTLLTFIDHLHIFVGQSSPSFSSTVSSLLLIEPRVCVCVCAKCDQFLPARFYFESKRPENFVRIAKFPYAAFGPLFAFHCPFFFTRNNDLERKSSRFAVTVRSSVADKQLA